MVIVIQGNDVSGGHGLKDERSDSSDDHDDGDDGDLDVLFIYL